MKLPVIYEQRPEGNERALANRMPGEEYHTADEQGASKTQGGGALRWPKRRRSRDRLMRAVGHEVLSRCACLLGTKETCLYSEADEKPVQDSELRNDKIWITFQKDHCWAKAGRQFSGKDDGGLALAQTQVEEWEKWLNPGHILKTK